MAGVGTDPRPDLHEEGDVRPVVARASRGPSGLLIGGVVAVLALMLFLVLDARRRSLQAPAVRTAAVDRDALPARDPPPLYVPPPPIPVPTPTPVPAFVVEQPPFRFPTPPGPPQQPRIVYLPQPPQPAGPPPQFVPPPPRETTSSPALVIDLSGAAASGTAAAETPPDERGSSAPAQSTATARATAIAARATTVPQGTLIPAVLETAFDSNRPGFARAIVSRDVRGFDGSRILIPRGSRLVGDYGGIVAQGQNRALITWRRLIRPDGTTIALGSPVADEEGRMGVRANVDNHVFGRIAGALLQSALQVGVAIASRPGDGSVVLGLPGATFGGGGGGFNQGPTRPPTLTVRKGASIAVFVARDLDFTGFGSGR